MPALNRYVAIRREASFGQGEGASIQATSHIASESLKLNVTRRGKRQTRDIAPRTNTERNRFVSGSVDFFPNVKSMPFLVRSLYGKPSTATLGTFGGFLTYKHTFFPDVTGNVPATIGIQLKREDNEFLYSGLAATVLQFDAGLADEFSVRCNFIGSDEHLITVPASQGVPDRSLWLPREPGSAIGLKVEIDLGSGFYELDVDGLNIAYNVKKSLHFVTREETPYRLKSSLETQIKGRFSWIYNQYYHTYYERFRSNQPFGLRFTVTESVTNYPKTITFTIPNAYATGETPNIVGPGWRNTPISIPFMALFDGVSDRTSFPIEIVNTVPAVIYT